ncbi:MAG TPA: alpha-amylase family protein [Gaiellaceae bacterium]
MLPRGQKAIVRFLAVVVAAFALLCSPAFASTGIRYGVQDDAYLIYGPGTLNARLDRLQNLGVQVVRINVLWNQVEAKKGVYNWRTYDPVVKGLHQRGIQPILTLVSAPSWSNGGLGTNFAPTSGAPFAAFAYAAAKHYPFVTKWLIWNEPNQRRWLRPTEPSIYVNRLLNPAYAAIHRAIKHVMVGGGVTAPRAATGGVSPVAWIKGMAAAHAKLDAYAHNPYPSDPAETPTTGGCMHCTTLTMATLPNLISDVKKAFGAKKRIWLTEYGYQTNPPDTFLGVSLAKQALYMSEAALRAYLTPRVDLLINYLVEDEPDLSGWQSGVMTDTGVLKPSYQAFQVPLTVEKHTKKSITLWGQIRPGGGKQQYVLQELQGGKWLSVGKTSRTSLHGFFTRVVPAVPGASFRVLQLTRGLTSAEVTS